MSDWGGSNIITKFLISEGERFKDAELLALKIGGKGHEPCMWHPSEGGSRQKMDSPLWHPEEPYHHLNFSLASELLILRTENKLLFYATKFVIIHYRRNRKPGAGGLSL